MMGRLDLLCQRERFLGTATDGHQVDETSRLIVQARENPRRHVAKSGLVQMRVTAPGGWGRRPEVDAPGVPRPAPGACPRCQLDPSHPQFVTRHRLPLNHARNRAFLALHPHDDRQNRKNSDNGFAALPDRIMYNHVRRMRQMGILGG